FLDGILNANDYQPLLVRTEGERDAARAEVERLQQQASRVEADAAMLDAEAHVAERLAELRTAVAGRLDTHEGIDALRVASAAIFESVVLAYDGERFKLEPHLRLDSIAQAVWWDYVEPQFDAAEISWEKLPDSEDSGPRQAIPLRKPL